MKYILLALNLIFIAPICTILHYGFTFIFSFMWEFKYVNPIDSFGETFMRFATFEFPISHSFLAPVGDRGYMFTFAVVIVMYMFIPSIILI